MGGADEDLQPTRGRDGALDQGRASSMRRYDQDRPHSARMYDYYLGGKTNYAVDREAAERAIQQFPAILTVARVNRTFMHRAVRFLADDAGIRQFLDIGSGIPTAPNLHEIAQEQDPSCRIVYVDTDPIVLAYSDALLTSSLQGRTSYLQGSVTEPDALIAAVESDGCIDLDAPVALSLHALLHFVPDDQRPYRLVEQLLDRLAPGSYLSLSHCTGQFAPQAWQSIVDLYRQGGTPAQVRSREEIEQFFRGLDVVPPGVVVAHQWNPRTAGGPSLISNADASLYAGIGRKR